MEDKKLYVTVEERAFCISSNSNKLSIVLCNRLSSEQEEADTKVFLCAKFAFDNGFERVNIVTVDTDVAILGIYFQSMLNGKIYLQYGTSPATTLYDLPENLSDRSLVQALPGLHAFSGCDTTSCFKGKGTFKKHIFSERGFACYFKFFPTKIVLIDKIHVHSKIQNIPTNVQCVIIDNFIDILCRDVANFARA